VKPDALLAQRLAKRLDAAVEEAAVVAQYALAGLGRGERTENLACRAEHRVPCLRKRRRIGRRAIEGEGRNLFGRVARGACRLGEDTGGTESGILPCRTWASTKATRSCSTATS
jgi:hypothetical protein